MTTAPAQRTRARRWLVAAAVIVGAVALYGIVGGLVVPYFGRTAAMDTLGERLGRKVVIDELSLNPYTLAAGVKGFRILEPDGKTPFASFERMDLDGSILSIRHWAPVFDQVTLEGLKVNLVRESATRYNVTDVLARLAEAEAKAPPSKDKALFSLNNIRLKNARVDFDDRPKGTRHQVSDIDVAIPFVSNLPVHLKEFVRPSFAAKVNGAPLSLSGETLPFESSHRTRVAIDLDALEVKHYVEYAPEPLPVTVDSGKLDARLSVSFTQSAGKQPSVDLSGKLALRDLQLSAPAGIIAKAARIEADVASLDPLAGVLDASAVRISELFANGNEWRVPAAEAKDIRVDAGKKSVKIEALATQGGVFPVKRRADGSIERPLHAALAKESSGSPAWTVALGKLRMDDYSATLTDVSVKPATTHRVSVSHLEASDFSTAPGSKTTLGAKLVVGKGGTADLEGTLQLDPLVADLRIDARRLDLVPMRPYAAQFPLVAMKSGNASAKGHLVAKAEGNAMRVAWNGAAEIANLATLDTANRADLLNWDSVRATGIALQWGSNDVLKLAVTEVAVNKAYSRIVVQPDGKLNVQQLMAATEAQPNAPAPPPQPEKAQARDIRIERITFAASRLDFTDLFIRPNYSADVGGLSGSVTNLSSDPASRAEVDLKGSYSQTSPVVIAGTVNPLSGNLFLDITAKGKDIQLPALSAYSQRYAGYGITQGKLSLDVKYHVEDGKMEGRNRIFIEQLTFGERVEGPDATKLPVLFAVNLLKNSKGEIDLELPVSGSLEDPQFNVGALIVQVVGNLLKKAVTAPFTLLAAAFGGGGDGKAGAGNGGAEDLAFVEFEPGGAEIGPAGQKKLDSLSKALLDRPAIKLEMAGHADAQRDLQALKRQALQRKVAAANGNLKAVFDAEKIPRAPAKDGKAVELSNEEMEALLLERMSLGDAELDALAQQRAEQVKAYLVGKGQLPAERVVVATAPEKLPASRVAFKLQ
jgi:hypothetical protein